MNKLVIFQIFDFDFTPEDLGKLETMNRNVRLLAYD